MSLVEQWRRLEEGLPPDWAVARLVLVVGSDDAAARAAALLGPLNPGRSGTTIRFESARRGAGAGPTAVQWLLARLDEERIDGDLQLVSVAEAEPAPEPTRTALAGSWDEQVAALPADWSDLWAEVELDSTDHLDRGALLMAPLNPSRFDERPAFRFRVARKFGYGAAPQMVRRCLERLDSEPITGAVRILDVLSETEPVDTQGPVRYAGGKVL